MNIKKIAALSMLPMMLALGACSTELDPQVTPPAIIVTPSSEVKEGAFKSLPFYIGGAYLTVGSDFSSEQPLAHALQNGSVFTKNFMNINTEWTDSSGGILRLESGLFEGRPSVEELKDGYSYELQEETDKYYLFATWNPGVDFSFMGSVEWTILPKDENEWPMSIKYILPEEIKVVDSAPDEIFGWREGVYVDYKAFKTNVFELTDSPEGAPVASDEVIIPFYQLDDQMTPLLRIDSSEWEVTYPAGDKYGDPHVVLNHSDGVHYMNIYWTNLNNGEWDLTAPEFIQEIKEDETLTYSITVMEDLSLEPVQRQTIFAGNDPAGDPNIIVADVKSKTGEITLEYNDVFSEFIS